VGVGCRSPRRCMVTSVMMMAQRAKSALRSLESNVCVVRKSCGACDVLKGVRNRFAIVEKS